VVLSGGASYAAYEIGVMRALFSGDCPATGHAPLTAEVFSGLSAGSFNAAVMVSQPGVESLRTVDYLESVWLDALSRDHQSCRDGAARQRANLLKLLDPVCVLRDPVTLLAQYTADAAFFARDWTERLAQLVRSDGNFWRRMLELVDLGTTISIDPFLQVLRRHLDLDGIVRSEKELRITATNWDTGELTTFRNSDLAAPYGWRVVLASSSFPGLPPVPIDGALYVDGGFAMDSPLKDVIGAGADTLHVVYMDPGVRKVPVRRAGNTVDTVDKLYSITRATILDRDIERARVINRTLETIDRFEASGEIASCAADLLRRTPYEPWGHDEPPRPYRALTIHRYHPHDELGGVVGLLNFDREHIADLIDRGYADTVRHDCRESRCVIPGRDGVQVVPNN